MLSVPIFSETVLKPSELDSIFEGIILNNVHNDASDAV